MSQAISLISGSPLIGSPIVFSVTPATHQSEWTFHRVLLKVYAKIESDADYSEFDFSTPVETDSSGSVLSAMFDISSALRAVADKYEYEATPPMRYPYIKFRLESSEEWMVDGRTYDQQNVSILPGFVNSTIGENILTGTQTGSGWTDGEGDAASYIDGRGFFVTDTLMSPTVVLSANTKYVLTFNHDDQFDVYLYDVASGASTQLSVETSANTAKAYISNFGGQFRIVIRTGQEGYYWNLSLMAMGTLYLYYYAFMGSFTDLERMKASVDQSGVEYLNLSNMSRKPTSTPEIVFNNIPYIYPATFNRGLDSDYIDSDTGEFVNNAPTDGPKSVSVIPQFVMRDPIPGHNIYVITAPTDAYVLRFINGMGCMESLHVESLVKREVPIQTDKHTVAKQETLKKFSRSVVRKSNDRETWYLTSGPLDREWASWYIHEFLMSEQVWIGLNSQFSILNSQLIWIPCHVVPEETTVLEDLTKAQPYEVQFKLEMDINGSPL